MIINMTSGGGAGLNLKVVGGTIQPTGSENTVWVNTDTAITSYVFSATRPGVEEVTSSNLYTSSGASIDTALIDYDEPGEYEGWIVTKHIALPSNTKKLVCTFPYSNNDCFALYDSEKNFLTGVDYTAGTAEYSVPEGTAFIRISHRNDSTKPEVYAVYEQSDVVEGMVWIKTATESTTPINVDKNNAVMLYPQTAQQYIGGAWVGKTAQVYTDGAWHELWDGYYYKAGEVYEAITGGYSAGTNLAKVTFNSNNMVITQASGTSAGNVVATVNTVDVTDVSTLVFDCHCDAADLCSVGVGSVRNNWNSHIATKAVNNTARALITLDVSSITGKVYILLRAWYNSATYKGALTVYNIYKQ